MNKKYSIFLIFVLFTILIVLFCSCSDKESNAEGIVEISVKFYIGDELYQESTYKTGDLIYAPDIKEYNGYTISYWAIGNGWVFMPYTAGTEDIVFKAVTYKEVPITYYSDSEVFYSGISLPGEKIYAPFEVPVKEGYTFQYWTINNEKASFPYKISDTDKSYVFNAYFIKNVDVKFYVDDYLYETKNIPYASTISSPSAPTKEKYNFICWKDEEGNILDNSKQITSSESYYAVFEQVMYEVNYYIEGTLYQKLIVESYAPNIYYPNAEYFYGWYKDSSFKTKFDFSTKITSNINLYGKTVSDNFQVLYNQFGSSSHISISDEKIADFDNNYSFDNYKNIMTLALNKYDKSAIVSYKFQRANKKYIIISYDVINGLIKATYGSTIDEGAYSYVELSVSQYKYADLSFSSYSVINYNEGSFVTDLTGLSLQIAEIAYNEIHGKYKEYIAGFDNTITYDEIPSFTPSCTINNENGVISFSSNVNAFSVKISANNNVVAYSTNVKEVKYNSKADTTYDVVVKFVYTVNSKQYMCILSKTI